MARYAALPLGFVFPANSQAGRTMLGPLLAAVLGADLPALAALRAEAAAEATAFDQFVSGLHCLAAGDYKLAASHYAQVRSPHWRVAGLVLRAIAIAADGDLRLAIESANQARDLIDLAKLEGAPSFRYDRALFRACIASLQLAEAGQTGVAPPRKTFPFRYILSYPRSGNSMLGQFLSFAFAAPRYSVYPGDGRYFSRRFHNPAPGHPVFVKDHVWHDDYLGDKTLHLVRDGRDVVVSLARYLYAMGSHRLVHRGELADFLTFVAEHMPYGSWGQHTRTLLDAGQRGAQIRTVRYEEIFGDYQRLAALAVEIADGAPVVCDDEAKFAAIEALQKRSLATTWSEGLALPEDSYIPKNWSVGAGAIQWHQAFDARARRRFHELGGTEMLIRLGYETDESWWRQG